MTKSSSSRRAVIVGGVRTPFVRAFGQLMKVDTIQLASAAVAGLIGRTGINPTAIGGVSWGGVILPPMHSNVGREVVLELKLPATIQAMTVSRACASGLQAITSAAQMIEAGECDVMIAGGSDSTSNMALSFPPKTVHTLAPLIFGKGSPSASDVLGVLSQIRPITELLPARPKVAERSTGELMGESAESMAKRNEISRQSQDALAARSHARASAAVKAGIFADEIVPVEAAPGQYVSEDDLIRDNTSEEKLAKLSPVFDRANGTITAGSASPLTDGAAAVLMMTEERAHALGLKPLAALRSYAYVGVDPFDQLLIGPAMSMPLALERASMELGDIDLVDIHEAFAAQVLCVTKALASDAFAKSRLGRDKAVGEIDDAAFNVHGGSIAIGHPFAATGARMVTTIANELHRSDKQTALLGICAAGGLGAAAVLERI